MNWTLKRISIDSIMLQTLNFLKATMYLMLYHLWFCLSLWSQFLLLSWSFTHFSAFKSVFPTIKLDGIFSMLLLTSFRATTKTEQSLILMICVGSQLWSRVEDWCLCYACSDTLINVLHICSCNDSFNDYSSYKLSTLQSLCCQLYHTWCFFLDSSLSHLYIFC